MITEKEIMKIANLAKLEIKEEEVPVYIEKMQAIISFADSIDCVTEETEPEVLSADFSSLRADEVKPSTDSTEILSNAKDSENGFFRLRKRA